MNSFGKSKSVKKPVNKSVDQPKLQKVAKSMTKPLEIDDKKSSASSKR